MSVSTLLCYILGLAEAIKTWYTVVRLWRVCWKGRNYFGGLAMLDYVNLHTRGRSTHYRFEGYNGSEVPQGQDRQTIDLAQVGFSALAGINSVQTRCIVKGEAQKSPLFWQFSRGL